MSSPSPKETSSSSLKSKIDAVAATKKFHKLFTIANEIYTAFFATTTLKTVTKEFLEEQLKKIESVIPAANKADFQVRIEEVKKNLKNATSTSTTPPVKPVVTPTKKDVVFAFDIDNTLVQHGTLESSPSPSFNATHAAEHDKMVALMKEIIKAGYYVWIVTANTNITKDNFEKNYLQSNTDNSITSSDKYYFMNPGVVTSDLSEQFKTENFTSFNKTSTSTHDLNFTNSGNEFQNKGLKPYAMRAKWMQLGHAIDDANVEMYLFDDSQTYEANCKSLKVNFVKIKPSTVSGGTPNFSSDVLQQATEVFEKIETSSGPGPTSGGGNLNVMTFNTWHQALGNPPNQKFCMDGTTNKCQNYIRQAILDHMKKHEQSIVFLQEFTYKFDEFFNVSGAEVTVNKDGFASKTMAKDSSSTSTSIPAFRYFTMTYDSKTFHVYIGQIGFSVIATIYSDTFHAGPADAFFVGNLAAGNLKVGSSNESNAESYDLAYTFSGTSDKTSLTETKPPKGVYSAFGGNRPFIVLRFDTKKCVLVNVHVPHDDVFRDESTGKPTGKPTGSLANFAFNALARFIPDTVFKDKSKTQSDYAFILGGDFNTATPDIKKWLTESTTPAGIRTTGTCCTTSGGLDFTTQGAFDHIFSTLPITKYSVHDIIKSKTEKTTTKPRYFFSDHLPVYAEIDFKAPAATAASSP